MLKNRTKSKSPTTSRKMRARTSSKSGMKKSRSVSKRSKTLRRNKFFGIF